MSEFSLKSASPGTDTPRFGVRSRDRQDQTARLAVVLRQVGVLLISGPTEASDLEAAVAELRSAGARTLVASLQPVTGLDPDAFRSLADSAQAHGPGFRRDLRGAAGPEERLWLHVRDDPWVAERVPGIDLVVPLDQRAALAATRLADRFPRLRVAESVDTAVDRLTKRRPGRARSRAATATAREVAARLRRRLRGVRGTQREERRTQQAAREAVRLLGRGDDARAEEVVARALERIEAPRVRADLLGDVVSWALAHGQQPALAKETYAAELTVADRHLQAGEYGDAAASFMEAMRTAFHPVLHFDGLRSPLADDPTGFTAPLRHSTVADVLRHGRDPRPAEQPPGPRPRDERPARLLIATQHNADFLTEITEHFTAHPGYDTRAAFFADSPTVARFGKHPVAFVEQVLSGRPGLPRALERTFREHLERSDVVLVEWATALAALVSRTPHPGTRVVVRLHSYEAFSPWPHLVDWGNVDDVVLVSDHLRDLVRRAVPGLAGRGAPRLHVLPNAMDLGRFTLPKDDEARFTLGVVGASKLVKDPRWAIDVVRRLRRHDERYRLRLVRSKFQDTSAATHGYAEALRRDLAELEPLGAVVPMQHTDDVPAALREVGVVVSSSVRESFHIGLVEGAASGALPVVRDWPFFPGAARRLFPEDWVVDTPEAAAERILALTQDVGRWRQETAAAAEHALTTWDWTVVRGRFEEILRPIG
jgi:glycosyltransferase involved in cell wall biosynthesis